VIPPTTESFAAAASVLAAYCRSLDTGDLAGLRSVFTADAELVLADGTAHGVDAIAARYAPFFASARTSRHHLTNLEVLAASDTEIEASAYLLVVTERAGNVSIASGTYRDHLLRQDGAWLIQRKAISMEVPFARVATRADGGSHRRSGGGT